MTLATYRNSNDVTELNNPLLRALPEFPENTNSVTKIFYDEQHFDDRIRNMSVAKRKKVLSNVNAMGFIPTDWHYSLSDMVDSLLYSSYTSYDPLDVYEKNRLFMQISDRKVGLLKTTGNGGMLIGRSGIGKTTALKLKVGSYMKLIEHKEFMDKPFETYQVPVLFLSCPESGSIYAFMHEFFQTLYNVTGHDDILKQINKNQNVSDLIEPLQNKCLEYNIGLIVVDEVDFLLQDKAKARELKAFLTNLFNKLKTSILFVGTEQALDILQENEYLIRRATSEGLVLADYFEKGSMSWKFFAKKMWDSLQILKIPVYYSSEFDEIMYRYSQGSPNGFKSILKSSQQIALKRGVEQLTQDIVKQAGKEYYRIHKKAVGNSLITEMEKKTMEVSSNVQSYQNSKPISNFLYNEAEEMGILEALGKTEVLKLIDEVTLGASDLSKNEQKNLLFKKALNRIKAAN